MTFFARTFDGIDDEIVTSVDTPLDIVFGTMVAVIKRNSTTEETVCSLHTSAGAAMMSMNIQATGNADIVRWMRSQTVGAPGGPAVVNADNWVLISAAKTTGTATPDYGRYVWDTDIWTFQAATGTIANGSTVSGGGMRIGQRGATAFLAGDVAAVAYFSTALSETNVRTMNGTLNDWLALSPVGMWVFDQAAVTDSVLDVSGNASNQTSRVGTTISTNVSPIDWAASMPPKRRSSMHHMRVR